MDNLALARVAIEAARDLGGAILEDLRQDSEHRFRLILATAQGTETLVASLRPELPWIGRPRHRWEGPRWSPDRFIVAARKELAGRRVSSVTKPAADRTIVLAFGDGTALAVELATHRANLVLLGRGGAVLDAFRRPRSGQERLVTGRTYEARALPSGQLDPWTAPPAEIDAFLDTWSRSGEPVLETLRRRVFGIGTEGAGLVVAEAVAVGRTPGSVLRERLDELARGEGEIGIMAPGPIDEAVESGTFSTQAFRLLPWRGRDPIEGATWIAGRSAAATAGQYHEAAESAAQLSSRIASLGAILHSEVRKTRDAAEHARASLRAFEDPDRFRRQGEALLAGLAVARRSVSRVVVPDPYDPAGAEIVIDAPGERSLAQVADGLFRRHRRARRGIAATEDRIRLLAAREAGLVALATKHLDAKSRGDAAELETGMRAVGLAVGLAPPSRAGRAAASARPPRLSGVRMYTSVDGLTILVGRTGRDNDRLTFKIAGPEDLWLHAAGVPGAHVVVRVPEKGAQVSEESLRTAARWAAWFSDARGASAADVIWTRRKNVRRARGAPAGQVVLKRSETLRVRPTPPPGEDGSGVAGKE